MIFTVLSIKLFLIPDFIIEITIIILYYYRGIISIANTQQLQMVSEADTYV